AAAHASHAATASVGGTAPGLALGTAAYMSPEQARGRPVDKRTDIWAFGCVLYEMLAGRRAFGADTRSDAVARVLEREPDWTAIPAGVPASVMRLLQRCLRKDAADRLHDIADARLEIVDALSALASSSRNDAVVTRKPGLGWISIVVAA